MTGVLFTRPHWQHWIAACIFVLCRFSIELKHSCCRPLCFVLFFDRQFSFLFRRVRLSEVNIFYDKNYRKNCRSCSLFSFQIAQFCFVWYFANLITNSRRIFHQFIVLIISSVNNVNSCSPPVGKNVRTVATLDFFLIH